MVKHTCLVLLKAGGTPGKPSYPSIPGYSSTRNNSNPRDSKPHCGKRHNPQTYTEQTTARALCPQITQRTGGFQGEVLSCPAATQDLRFILSMQT